MSETPAEAVARVLAEDAERAERARKAEQERRAQQE